ncbi:branched-chain amino acid transport system II carrier protein [Loigolactobacillus binensis]|uniref:Branched-chain amino acid transport system carrier protein n=1 Tax=Loigolactobacillus binensis TaxID=2559922 RepID=A0ABW3EFH9_9LACO|nr:branched-chain amino acid transport system II carrier protein [Loigolactobacillus binensis]
MQQHRLTKREYLYIGSMLFGLFFGAGNLIFPVFLGQNSGQNIGQANLGFLVTGIGLPLLGVIAIGMSQSKGVFELAKRVGRPYAYLFTILLYLTIGPFFALPRLATTSFQIGIIPFLKAGQQTGALLIFSIIFFAITWWFARRPSQLIAVVGKYLTPAFLIILGLLLITALTRPMGGIDHATVTHAYQQQPFLVGFTEGYNTMDALAALAFGVIVTDTIRKLGVTKPTTIALDTMKSGLISLILMGVIYTLLALMGTMSLGQFKPAANGGIALAAIAHYYFGDFGSFLLALLVILACIKTAIGLVSAFGETFQDLFPQGHYLWYITGASILPALFANVGLTAIIAYSTPILMFIYPLAITLMLLGIGSALFKHRQIVYVTTTLFTLIAAIADGVHAAPAAIAQTTMAKTIVNLATNYLPFFKFGMGWLIPALSGLVLGLLLAHFLPPKTPTQQI